MLNPERFRDTNPTKGISSGQTGNEMETDILKAYVGWILEILHGYMYLKSCELWYYRIQRVMTDFEYQHYGPYVWVLNIVLGGFSICCPLGKWFLR